MIQALPFIKHLTEFPLLSCWSAPRFHLPTMFKRMNDKLLTRLKILTIKIIFLLEPSHIVAKYFSFSEKCDHYNSQQCHQTCVPHNITKNVLAPLMYHKKREVGQLVILHSIKAMVLSSNSGFVIYLSIQLNNPPIRPHLLKKSLCLHVMKSIRILI